MKRSGLFGLAAAGILLAMTAMSPAQAAGKKLSASAIQIAMVEAGDVQIPPEFRFAVYESLVDRVRASGAFTKVYREGDHAADGVADLVTLHTRVDAFNEGSQTKRELTTVLGATTVDVTATVTGHDGKTLVDHKITGRVRFFGENLGVTNDIAKRITKLVRESF
ncbi:MAG TPA: hypothetical protein VG273_08590 [Bryobacteraceae bacterium]|nr:hypothetical protein [Bryobacteraceae bacterium]